MKKRVFMLAVVMGVLLSFCTSALAATAGYTVNAVTAGYSSLHAVSARTSETINIKIYADVSYFGLADGNDYLPADTFKVSLSGLDQVLKDYSLTVISGTGATIDANNTYVDFALNDSNKSTVIQLSGTFKGAAGSVTVTGALYKNGTAVTGGTGGIGGISPSHSATITFATTGTKEQDEGTQVAKPYSGVPVYPRDNNPIDLTGANFDSKDLWDGKDPVFTNGITSYDKKLKLKIATSKPSFTKGGATAKALTSGVSDDFTVEIKGPVDTIDVYVAAKDAIKLGWLAKGATTNIRLTSADIKKYAIPFRVTSYDMTSSDNMTKDSPNWVKIAYNGAHVSYKGFPITVAAINKNSNNKWATKTYKIDIASTRATPQWVDSSGHVGDDMNYYPKKNTAEISVPVATSATMDATAYTVSGDAPYAVTAKGDRNGLTAAVHSADVNKYGEVVTPGYVVISGAVTEAEKETKTAFTLTAAGLKKTNFKATVIGKIKPIIQKKGDKAPEGYIATKRVEAGKVPSVKFSAKGSKTITWEIDPDSLAQLEEHNLSFDLKKGSVVIKDSTKKELITPTIGDIEVLSSDGETVINSYEGFQSFDIHVYAVNEVGQDEAYAQVAITGKKPKFDTKTIVISRDELADMEDGAVLYDNPILMKLVEDADYQNFVFSFADDTSKTNLAAVGLGLVDNSEPAEEGYLKIVSSKDIKATKGTKINVNASCYGATAKGSVTVSIVDPAPEIKALSPDLVILDAATKGTTKTVTLNLVENPTGDTKLKWNLKTKPANSDVDVKVKGASDGKTAEVTIKLKKDVTAGATTTAVINVTNTNAKPKLTGPDYTLNIQCGTAAPASSSKALAVRNRVSLEADAKAEGPAADDTEGENEEDTADTEEVLVFGAPRTVAQLTAGQNAFLAEKGYKVVAVLPEVTAKVDGQQEFEVELDEDAPEGAKLIWLPFPKNAPETDDDTIADFYDAEGSDIEEVPAGKVIVVAPWLRAGVTYQPVIAVEE